MTMIPNNTENENKVVTFFNIMNATGDDDDCIDNEIEILQDETKTCFADYYDTIMHEHAMPVQVVTMLNHYNQNQQRQLETTISTTTTRRVIMDPQKAMRTVSLSNIVFLPNNNKSTTNMVGDDKAYKEQKQEQQHDDDSYQRQYRREAGERLSKLYTDLIHNSKTVVLPDTCLLDANDNDDSGERSIIARSLLDKLKLFTENDEGRVVIIKTNSNNSHDSANMGKKTFSSISESLAHYFGCKWKGHDYLNSCGSANSSCGRRDHDDAKLNCTFVPTARNIDIFGPSTMIQPRCITLCNGPKSDHDFTVMIVPSPNERLYHMKPPTEEEYFTNNYDGVSSDEDLDDEEINDAQIFYQQHVDDTLRYNLLAVHKVTNNNNISGGGGHRGGGEIIWIGCGKPTSMNILDDNPKDNVDTQQQRIMDDWKSLIATLCCY